MPRPKGSKNKPKDVKVQREAKVINKVSKVKKTEKVVKPKEEKELKQQYDYVKNPHKKLETKKTTTAEKMQEENVERIRLTYNQGNTPQIFETNKQKIVRLQGALIKKNINALLKNIALNQFKWENLPETMSERLIEHGYLTRGSVTIFNDSKYGWLGLPSLPCFYNINGDKIYSNVYGYGGYYKQVKIIYDKESKLEKLFGILSDVGKNIKAEAKGVSTDDNDFNELGQPYLYINYINSYTEILTNLKLGMLISAERLKQPFIVAIKKKGLEKASNKIVSSIHANETSVVLISEPVNATQSIKDYMEFIDLKGDNEAPKKLQELYENQLNEFLSIFGINSNPSPDKSQYVNSPEINSNNEYLRHATDIRFKNRKLLCERANELLGLNISVKINEDEDERLKEMEKGGVENDIGGVESKTE